ncbi:MAG: LicD family protein [Deltaproteobacteria bacterium]
MERVKPRVIVFGAGGGGKLFLKKIGYKYKIIAFSDNDKNKHGKTIDGYLIIPPESINMDACDQILLASYWADEIRAQLTEELNIPDYMIKDLPKTVMSINKNYRPFVHEKTIRFARQLLVFIVNVLQANNIEYYIDHGTLLGIIRDGDLIPWDDDLDISVPEKYQCQTLDLFRNKPQIFPFSNDLNWHCDIISYNETGKTLGVIIYFDDRNRLGLKKFATTIWFMFYTDGMVGQYINRSPDHFFNGYNEIEYLNKKFRIPVNCESYLEYHYGDWRKPKKDISFSEINNYVPPEGDIDRDDLLKDINRIRHAGRASL